MATGTIPKVTNDSGSGYCKMPDGTLIQWGRYEVKSGTFTQAGSSGVYAFALSFSFPIPFASDYPAVFGSTQYSTGHRVASGYRGASKTTSAGVAYDFYPRVMSTTNKLFVEWCAIGRWK